MSKKHFIELADVIREQKSRAMNGSTPFTYDQIEAIAGFCKSQNYAFNKSRWLAYIAGECGPCGEKIQ